MTDAMSGVIAVFRRVAGFALAVLWAVALVVFVLALRLMSIDEEWNGWADAVPLVAVFAVLSLVVWSAAWWLLRDRR